MLRRALPLAVLVALTACASHTDRLHSAPRPSAEAAIERVIRDAYVEGVWRQRDPDLVRAGFAPTFVMQVHWNGELRSRTLDQWLAKMKLDRVRTERETRAAIRVLEITGTAAVARIDLHVDGEHRFTDYFGLYETAGGWKIVTKIFHAHRNP